MLTSVRHQLTQAGFTQAEIESMHKSLYEEQLKMDLPSASDDGDVEDAAGNGYTTWKATPSSPIPVSNGSISGGAYQGTLGSNSVNSGNSIGNVGGVGGNVGNIPQVWGTYKTSSTQNIALQKNAIVTATKSKLRYVIIKQDGSTLEMREQPSITPREMIGICKLMSLIATYVGVVLGDVQGVYNVNISWSKLIKELAIEKHFVEGMLPHSYNQDDEVLDIFLYDPPQ